MLNNFLLYDNDMYIYSYSLSIKDNSNIQNTYIITNDFIYSISDLECKLPIIKNLYSIK